MTGQYKTCQLAQFNLGRARYAFGDPRMAEFFAAADRVNAAAERAPGFVARVPIGSAGDAWVSRRLGLDRVLLNLSVWADSASLKAFTYSGLHADFFRRRKEWFERYDGPPYVLWWLADGNLPRGSLSALKEALDRLEHLRLHGPTPEAFTFSSLFPPPGQVAF